MKSRVRFTSFLTSPLIKAKIMNNNYLMPFGSIMNGLQGQLTPENWEEIATAVMFWCKTNVPDEPFPDKMPQRQPVGQLNKPCPVCGKAMLHITEKRNANAPDWKCQDKNCKWQWDKESQGYIKSDFITGTWDKK